jgi:hypothetical protein
MLKALTIALTCVALLSVGALADGEDSPPPDTNGDPVEPHGGRLATPDEMVIGDVFSAWIVLSWMVPWVIR